MEYLDIYDKNKKKTGKIIVRKAKRKRTYFIINNFY